MRSLLIAGAVAMVGTSTVSAASLGSVAPSTIESDVHVFVVGENGSVTEDDETTLRANTVAGIDDIAQRYVWFDKNTTHVDILGACTIDRNGVEHPVVPSQIVDVQEPHAAGATAFEDAQLQAVIFPGAPEREI